MSIDREREAAAPAARSEERRAVELRIHDERERYRVLVEQIDIGIYRTDAENTVEFVNDRYLRLMGVTSEAQLGHGRWLERVHPEDRAQVRASGEAAFTARREWAAEYRVADAEGRWRWVRSKSRPLHGPDGAFAGYLGTCVDLSDLRAAEDDRRALAVAREARAGADAARARVEALVSGLGAVVWERDAGTGQVLFINERVTELLGYPRQQWLADPDLWTRLLHPDDRDTATGAVRAGMATGDDFHSTYRMIAADGREVCLHDAVHVVRDADGRPQSLQGVLVDVTEQKRQEHANALLVRVGTVQNVEGPLAERLRAVAGAAVGELAELCAIALVGPDGLLRPLVAVAPAHPEVVAAGLALPPARLPEPLAARLAAGRAFAIPGAGEEVLRQVARDDADLRARLATGVHDRLVVPLTAPGRTLGTLSFNAIGRRRAHDEFDIALAEELGRRVTSMILADEAAGRERALRRVTTALAAADTVAGVAVVLMDALTDAVEAVAQTVFAVDAEHRALRLVHARGYAREAVDQFRSISLDLANPIADAGRTGEPVWLHDHDDWDARYPQMVEYHRASGYRSAMALPLTVAGRTVAVLAASFTTPRTFHAGEREFAMTLTAIAADAYRRADEADQRRDVAEALQHALLPAALPAVEGLTLATRYLPGAAGVQAGGDWFDVIVLDDHRTAVVVGDVVGQGAPAAAIMGQLRSMLATILRLAGHDAGPAAALAQLNRITAAVPGARGSTAVCVVLDSAAQRLSWACAGHPPPLLVPHRGPARYLDRPGGPLLGLVALHEPPPGPYPEFSLPVEPGDAVVLYTDGLVERRGEVIDAGMDRLIAGAANGPAALVERLLAAAVPGGGSHDDIVVVAARVLPPALHGRRPARPDQLAEVRRDVDRWARAGGLSPEVTYDLQIAIGEAVANAVEHAYRDTDPGEFTYTLRRHPDGTAVDVQVTDEGTWRTPGDPGYRGRGLALIRALTGGAAIDHAGSGTAVRFTLDVPPSPDGTARPRDAIEPAATPLTMHATAEPGGGLRIALRGDIDLPGVERLRPDLRRCLKHPDHPPDPADPTPLVIDLHEVSTLASAGVGLLWELADIATPLGWLLTLDHPPAGIAARVLQLSGLDRVVPDPLSRA